MTIEYRPNNAHRIADAMSRRPHRKHGDCPSCKEINPEVSIIQWPFPFTAEDLREAQCAYRPTAVIISWLEQGVQTPLCTNRERREHAKIC